MYPISDYINIKSMKSFVREILVLLSLNDIMAQNWSAFGRQSCYTYVCECRRYTIHMYNIELNTMYDMYGLRKLINKKYPLKCVGFMLAHLKIIVDEKSFYFRCQTPAHPPY